MFAILFFGDIDIQGANVSRAIRWEHCDFESDYSPDYPLLTFRCLRTSKVRPTKSGIDKEVKSEGL